MKIRVCVRRDDQRVIEKADTLRTWIWERFRRGQERVVQVLGDERDEFWWERAGVRRRRLPF